MKKHMIEKAITLIDLKRINEAEKTIQKILMEDPENMIALSYLGKCKLISRKPEKCLEIVLQIKKINPENDYAYYLSAEAHLLMKRFNKSKQEIQHALMLAPGKAAYYAVLSRAHLLQHELPEALQTAVNGLKIDPENINALAALGGAQAGLQNYEEALETFRKALTLAPENPELLASMGFIMVHKSEYSTSEELFLNALRQSPEFKEAATNYVLSKALSHKFYSIHEKILKRYFGSKGKFIFLLAMLFQVLLTITELGWTTPHSAQKLLMICTWCTLFTCVSIHLIQLVSCLLYVFKVQFKHLFSFRQKIVTVLSALIYAISIFAICRAILETSENTRSWLYLSLTLLTFSYPFASIFHHLHALRWKLFLYALFFYTIGGIAILWGNLAHPAPYIFIYALFIPFLTITLLNKISHRQISS